MPPHRRVYTSFPTQREAAEISHLDITTLSTLPSSRSLLQNVLTFCLSSQVKSFLFSSECIELNHMANPFSVKSAVSGCLKRTGMDMAPLNLTSDHLHGTHAIFPVFTVDNLTFGFAVHESRYTPMSKWYTEEQPVRKYHSRFVQDETTSSLLFVFNVQDMQEVFLDHTAVNSRTSITHLQARFERQPFFAKVFDDHVTPADLLPSLHFVVITSEQRNCPTCNQTRFCICNLVVKRSRHPYDNEAFRSNMRLRLGTYYGISKVDVFRDSTIVFSGAQRSKAEYTGGIDEGLISAFRKWSISSAQQPSHPRESMLLLDAQCDEEESNSQSSRGFADTQLAVPPSIGACFDTGRASFDQHDMQSAIQYITDALSNKSSSNDFRSDQTPCVVTNIDAVQSDSTGVFPESSSMLPLSNSEISQVNSETEHQPVHFRPITKKTRQMSSSASSNEATEREIVKKLRAELRKERNRASAQRSNLRKKAEYDSKKMEIRNNKEKTELLRAKEMKLREENTALRRLLLEQERNLT